MTNSYTFQTTQFGIITDSIQLLRNRFAYKTIPISSISSIDVKQGKEMKNWLWVLIIGLALTTYAIFDLLQIFGILTDNHTYTIYAERLLIPIFPLLLGIYSIVIALRNTKVMIVRTGDKSHYLSLRELIKNNQLESFISHLQAKYGGVHIIY